MEIELRSAGLVKEPLPTKPYCQPSSGTKTRMSYYFLLSWRSKGSGRAEKSELQNPGLRCDSGCEACAMCELIQLTSQDPGSVRVLVSKLWEVTEEGTSIDLWPPCVRAHTMHENAHTALVLPFDNYGWYPCRTKHQFCHSDRVGTVFKVFYSQCNHVL